MSTNDETIATSKEVVKKPPFKKIKLDTYELCQKAKPIPKQLLDRVQFELEEGLFPQAVHLLSSLLTSGLSTPGKSLDDVERIYIPPPKFLSIITTLCVHPEMTNKLNKRKYSLAVAQKSLQYMQTLVKISDIKDAQLRQAWMFEKQRSNYEMQTFGHTSRRTRHQHAEPIKFTPTRESGIVDTQPFAYLDMAHEENLFTAVDDIWNVVGWAFTCSVKHKARWRCWKPFLQMVLEAIERDQEARQISSDGTRESTEEESRTSLAACMGFLPNLNGTTGIKRAIRAIFANGSGNTNEWHEVFEYEIKNRPKKNTDDLFDDWLSSSQTSLSGLKGKRKEMSDDERGKLYDKFLETMPGEQDSESDKDSGEDDKDGTSYTEVSVEVPSDAFGGMDAVKMRSQFMSVLFLVLRHNSDVFGTLIEQCSDEIRLLPLHQMMLFTNQIPMPSDSTAWNNTYVLILYTLQSLMTVQPKGGFKSFDLSNSMLQDWYLPQAANKTDAESNAKYAVLLERIVRLHFVVDPKGLRCDEPMVAAMRKGSEARRVKVKPAKKVKAKVKTKTKGKGKGEEVEEEFSEVEREALRVLKFAEMQIEMLLECAQSRVASALAGKATRPNVVKGAEEGKGEDDAAEDDDDDDGSVGDLSSVEEQIHKENRESAK